MPLVSKVGMPVPPRPRPRPRPRSQVGQQQQQQPNLSPTPPSRIISWRSLVPPHLLGPPTLLVPKAKQEEGRGQKTKCHQQPSPRDGNGRARADEAVLKSVESGQGSRIGLSRANVLQDENFRNTSGEADLDLAKWTMVLPSTSFPPSPPPPQYDIRTITRSPHQILHQELASLRTKWRAMKRKPYKESIAGDAVPVLQLQLGDYGIRWGCRGIRDEGAELEARRLKKRIESRGRVLKRDGIRCGRVGKEDDRGRGKGRGKRWEEGEKGWVGLSCEDVWDAGF